MHYAHINNFHFASTVAATLISSCAFAQSDIVPAPTQSRPIAIIHAVVHTATLEQPVIEDGHVLFDGGRIMSVGASRELRDL